MTEEIATQAKRKKSPVEWIIIIGLGTLFAVIWFYAHWNLSRQPPHHKGPGAVDQPGKTSPPAMIAVPAGTVCITGCSRGLGRAMALEFARKGWKVAGCARTAEAIATLAEELGNPHIFQAVERHRRCSHALFRENSHRQPRRTQPARQQCSSHERQCSAKGYFSRGVRQNSRCKLRGCSQLHSGLSASHGGCRAWRHRQLQFLLGSLHRTGGSPLLCATKWAIEGLTQSLSQELPSGLAAVAFNPGIIDTDMLRSCFGEAAAGYHSPEDWARTAVPALASLGRSDNGSSVTAP